MTSFHVQTFNAEITFDITGKEEFDKIRELIKKAKTDGNITLVSETLAQFDGDSYNFVVSHMARKEKLFSFLME